MSRRTSLRSLAQSSWLEAAIATALFAALHSLLASNAAKSIAARLIGARRRDAYYRAFYNVQAVGTTMWLFGFIGRLPEQYAYEVQGRAAHLMRGGQAISLAVLTCSVYSVGVLKFLGIPQVLRGLTSGEPGHAAIEAQGPARVHNGALIINGPFRIQRHPTNFWPLGVLWLQPRMTYAGLGFSIVASVYLLAGSYHQDLRLRKAYGEQYESYRRGGVPLFFPRVPRRLGS